MEWSLPEAERRLALQTEEQRHFPCGPVIKILLCKWWDKIQSSSGIKELTCRRTTKPMRAWSPCSSTREVTTTRSSTNGTRE